MLNTASGEKIKCKNNSTAVIYQISGSNNSGFLGVENLRSEYGSLIRIYETASSSLDHYPNSDIPYDVNLAMVRFDNMT
jgi:hypothetical protein